MDFDRSLGVELKSVGHAARQLCSLAVRVADVDPESVAPADDASLNTVHMRVTEQGRVAIAADVTAVIGEKSCR
ncbi:hypothetical protein GA0061091_101155 [Gordonia sp. v-85]|nr:hypothetical protein GA0061091_101155 [Gordonia sp. v-85]